jgi:hypothetical protein
LTISFLSILTLTHAQVPSYVPTNGLVGWWPFNGNANDESGNGNNGTVNGATLTADRNGTFNSSYYFIGQNNFVSILANGLPQGNNSRSLNTWFKYKGSNAMLNQQHLIGYGPIINNQRIALLFWPNFSNHLAVVGQANDFDESTFNMDTLWHMCTITYDSQIVKLYVDGAQVSQAVKNYNTTGNTLFIGYNGNPNHESGEYFSGSLDDIAIWNRALTEAEILALYEGCQLAITTQPQDQNVTTSVGVANFSVASTATNPTYQWQTNLGLGFQNISNAGQYTGATTSSLTVSNLSMSNNNQVFRCIVNDGSCVDTTAEATLTIIDDASIQTNTLTSLKLYPNPVQDVLHVDGSASKEFEYEVLSIDGKLLQKGKSQGEISVKELRKGNYVLRVGQQQVSFVKQ